jgi:MFS family permease
MDLPARLSRRVKGAPAFLAVAATQLLSLLTSSISGFALAIWAFETTGQVLSIGLISVIQFLPIVLLSPIAGVLVDRYNRKFILILSDMSAALGALFLLVMASTNQLQVWHLYVEAFFVGISQTFQAPAYAATIGSLVDRSNLNRANSILTIVDWTPSILAPLLGAAAYAAIGLRSILVLDVATFALALITLALIIVPDHDRSSADAKQRQGSFWQELKAGASFLFSRASLRNMVAVGMINDIFLGVLYTIITPLVLATSAMNGQTLGWVTSAGALGVMIGAVILTIKSNIKQQQRKSILLQIVWGVSIIGFALSNSVWTWMSFLLMAHCCGQLTVTLQRSAWQSKVPPDVQGRVFALRRALTWLSSPLTPLLASLLADRWLEPLMTGPVGKSAFLAPLVGVEPGAGIAILALLAGIGVSICGLIYLLMPSVRNFETLLPDHTPVTPDVST